jgi:hypothetical protein
MFCPKCGQKVVVGTKFCPKCGKSLTVNQSSQIEQSMKSEGSDSTAQSDHQTKIRDADNTKAPLDYFALLGFIFGCISWALSLVGIISIAAVVFSVLGLNRHLEGTNRVIAIIGLVSGIINIIYGISVYF